MANTSADFFYLAANVAKSDRPEYAKYFRDAGNALAEAEKKIARLQEKVNDFKQAAGVEAKERRESHEREAKYREALELIRDGRIEFEVDEKSGRILWQIAFVHLQSIANRVLLENVASS